MQGLAIELYMRVRSWGPKLDRGIIQTVDPIICVFGETHSTAFEVCVIEALESYRVSYSQHHVEVVRLDLMWCLC